MFDQSPWCIESQYYCLLGELTIVWSIVQILTSIAVLTIIWKNHDIDGFSINFQCLYTIALSLKYWDDRKVEHLEIPAALDSIFEMQYWTKTYLTRAMIVTLLITVYSAKHDKFDAWWNAGAIIVSLVLALDHCSFKLTARDRWMIGSYMDLIAWITLFKFFCKTKTCSQTYFILMLLDHLIKISYSSYDNYRDELYGNVGYKLGLLKLFLFCCFIVKYMPDHTKVTNEVTRTEIFIKVSSGSSEPPVSNTTEKCRKKPVHTRSYTFKS